MVEFEIKRNMTPQNIAEITHLLDAVEKADNRKPLNDHLWIDLRQGGRPGFAGLTARHHRTGQPIAYCQISRGKNLLSIWIVSDEQVLSVNFFINQSHKLHNDQFHSISHDKRQHFGSKPSI